VTEDISIGIRDFLDNLLDGVAADAVRYKKAVIQPSVARRIIGFGVYAAETWF
jgi:hypothetical protein